MASVSLQAMVDDFMRDEFKPLTETQIDEYFRDGWITIGEKTACAKTRVRGAPRSALRSNPHI